MIQQTGYACPVMTFHHPGQINTTNDSSVMNNMNRSISIASSVITIYMYLCMHTVKGIAT